jgi:hypothetical protein
MKLKSRGPVVCRQTRSNSVLSGGVDLDGSYSSIKLLRSDLLFEKVLNCARKICCAPSLAPNNAQDRMFIDSSEVALCHSFLRRDERDVAEA